MKKLEKQYIEAKLSGNKDAASKAYDAIKRGMVDRKTHEGMEDFMKLRKELNSIVTAKKFNNMQFAW